jgi:hypothetical protein
MQIDYERLQKAFIMASSEVADEFYPKDEYLLDRDTGQPILDVRGDPIKTVRSMRRGEYLRDQAVLFTRLCQLLGLSDG